MITTNRISGSFLIANLLVAVVLIPVAPALAQTRPTTGADNEYQVGAILWTQSSGEYRALAYQAFAMARLRLDQDLRTHHIPHATTHRPVAPGRRPAIIVDADETVLDNSRFLAELVLRGLPYEAQSWRAWCERAEAGAVPGAVDFLRYAARRGVRVFYISNRRPAEKAGTILNLKKLGFPDVSEETVVVRAEGTPASKEARRQQVAAHYRIVLVAGDNLNDFSDDFSNKSTADRAAQVDRERASFGSRFIVVPNPMYGDWENAVYGNQPGLTEEQKHARRLAALKAQ